MRPTGEPTTWTSPGVVRLGVVAAALVAATLVATFRGGGSTADRILVVGGIAEILLAACLLLFALGRLEFPHLERSGAALVALTVLAAAWTGATVAWSVAPDRSWDFFDKTIVYAAFLGLGVVLAGVAGRHAARAAAAVLASVVGAVVVWALVTKSFPSLDPAIDRIGRLHEPVEYWNALALVADAGIVLGLWLGVSSGLRRGWRVAGGLLAYASVLALLLTLSRAGVAAAILVVALWLVVSPGRRVEGALFLGATGVPAGLVAAWAFTRPALVETGAAEADQIADGRVLGGLVVVGAAAVALLVGLASRIELGDSARTRVGRALLAGGALAVVVGVVAFAVAVGDPVSWAREQVEGRTGTEVVNDPSRLGSLNANNRWHWWHEAWDVFRHHGLEGAGAGTFEIARKRFREDAREVREPHSVPLQQLADGGIAGLGLFLGIVASASLVCARSLRRLPGPERAAAVAVVALPAAYLLHALVDYDWDFLAVTSPTMLALGALAGAGLAPAAPRHRPVVIVATVLLLVAVLVSTASPQLSEHAARESTRALVRGDLDEASRLASRARRFNPVAVEPILAQARVAERRRLRRTALALYVKAAELQPQNPETWYELGIYELQVLRNPCAAYRFLNEAYTRDPAGTQWVTGGALDQARDFVNSGRCSP